MPKPGDINNPEGKGGFADNPQNKASGRWKKENSQSYCLNFFLQLNEAEFLEWEKSNPPNKRTVAQALAFARVMKARSELSDYREVVDRTEGKPMQYSEIQAKVESSPGLSDELLKELDQIHAKNNPRD